MVLVGSSREKTSVGEEKKKRTKKRGQNSGYL